MPGSLLELEGYHASGKPRNALEKSWNASEKPEKIFRLDLAGGTV